MKIRVNLEQSTVCSFHVADAVDFRLQCTPHKLAETTVLPTATRAAAWCTMSWPACMSKAAAIVLSLW